MNRRRPQWNYAAIPQIPGEDRESAVLRKAASSAVGALTDQTAELPQAHADAQKRLRAFTAAYLLGYARQVALSYGIDCESNEELGKKLTSALCLLLPADKACDVSTISFAPRKCASGTCRAALRATRADGEAVCDAGYLVGHLEAMCGSRHLVRVFADSAKTTDDSGMRFLTACDNAADPMHSRAPTLSLRFSHEERAVILRAFDTRDAF